MREDGIVVSRRGSGSYVLRRPDSAVLRFVPVGSLADIQRAFEFRVGLEGAAAALAAQRRQEDDLDRIRQAFDALDDCIANNRVGAEADVRFHLAIARASRNPFHLSAQESFYPNTIFGINLTRNLSLLKPAARLSLVQNEHREIIKAIESRDSDAARMAMERHLQNAMHRIFEGTKPE